MASVVACKGAAVPDASLLIVGWHDLGCSPPFAPEAQGEVLDRLEFQSERSLF